MLTHREYHSAVKHSDAISVFLHNDALGVSMGWQEGEKMEEDKNLEEQTLDDVLKNPKMQAEFDKKFEAARAKWQKSWQEKAEAEKAEAERLARMSEEEKQQEAIRRLTKEKEESENTLKAYQLEIEAQKLASEKGLDIALLKTLDYRAETNDTIASKINDISDAFNKAVELAVNEKLKQKNPGNPGVPSTVTPEKTYLDNKYKDNPYYKK